MSPAKGVVSRDQRRLIPVDRDDGCAESASCLDCPLPLCKYDDPVAFYSAEKAQRDTKIVGMAKRGWTVPQLARQFELGERSVYRIVAGEENHGTTAG